MREATGTPIDQSAELRRIGDDLRQFMDLNCTRPGYDDFVGESCNHAYLMLQDTVRRIEAGRIEEKGADEHKTGTPS
jgi:hypothetical protein